VVKRVNSSDVFSVAQDAESTIDFFGFLRLVFNIKFILAFVEQNC